MGYKAGFWIVFLVSAVLFFTPLTLEEQVGLGLDKLVHIALFALMIYLSFVAYPRQKLLAVFLLLVYTVAVEFIQENYIPRRHFDIYDIGADAFGIISGIIYSGFRIKSGMTEREAWKK